MSIGKMAFTIAFGGLLSSCGSPQLPTPRHPIIPVAINNLNAHQVGDTVILNFTLPTTSTDQQPLAETPAVYIYRNITGQAAPGSNPGRKRSARGELIDSIPADGLSQYQSNGRVEFPDHLEASELSSSAGMQIGYSVRTSVAAGKDSADSNYAVLRVYP